ncbi:hypothetical protein PanWU01x14_201260 [Parasponia andersonii]|uniref:Uncharacterized protein n=1 Tax=Parasponia andersonii TaxID=3476 RepID=A0A2P5BXR3_PARAD|nr:hypothetical protein PanWU01x14_201260 [Parasponia andersonii]
MAEVSWNSSLALGANKEVQDGPKANDAFLVDSDNEGMNKCPSRKVDGFVPEVLCRGAVLSFAPSPLRKKARLRDLYVSDFNNIFLLQKSCSISRSHYDDTRLLRRFPPQIKAGMLKASWYSVTMWSSLSVLAMDPKECHFKGLLTSSTLALVRWHPYLASNPLLKRHGITRPIYPEVDDMISEVEESLATTCASLIPQLLSYSTVRPHSTFLGWHLTSNGRRGIAKARPRRSPTAIAVGLRPSLGIYFSLKWRIEGLLLQQFASKKAKSSATPLSQGESSQAQGLPLTFRSIEAPHGEGVPPSTSKAFAEYELFWARVEDAQDKTLEEKQKVNKKSSTSKETKGQLRKELESLRIEAEVSVSHTRGKAVVNFKNSQEFSDLYFSSFIDCRLEVMARFLEATIN